MCVYISIDYHRDGRSADFKMAKTLRVLLQILRAIWIFEGSKHCNQNGCLTFHPQNRCSRVLNENIVLLLTCFCVGHFYITCSENLRYIRCVFSFSCKGHFDLSSFLPSSSFSLRKYMFSLQTWCIHCFIYMRFFADDWYMHLSSFCRKGWV